MKRWLGGALVSCNLLLVRARSWNRAQLKSQPIFKPKFYEDCWLILENAHITSPEQGSKCRIEAKIIVSGQIDTPFVLYKLSSSGLQLFSAIFRNIICSGGIKHWMSWKSGFFFMHFCAASSFGSKLIV